VGLRDTRWRVEMTGFLRHTESKAVSQAFWPRVGGSGQSLWIPPILPDAT